MFKLYTVRPWTKIQDIKMQFSTENHILIHARNRVQEVKGGERGGLVVTVPSESDSGSNPSGSELCP